MYLPSINRQQEYRSDAMASLSKTLINDTERFNRLRKINLFKLEKEKVTEPIVEKFDKTKFIPPEYFFVNFEKNYFLFFGIFLHVFVGFEIVLTR
jgi:hypothetical protein